MAPEEDQQEALVKRARAARVRRIRANAKRPISVNLAQAIELSRMAGRFEDYMESLREDRGDEG